jgi:hypothetical protein
MMPRLLTEEAARDYLSIPLAAVRRLTVEQGRTMVDGYVRYDRLKIDRWLDGEPAPAPSAANANETAAASALARFKQSHPHAARRP